MSARARTGRRIAVAIGLATGLTVSAWLAHPAAPTSGAGPSASEAEADVVRRVNAVRAEHMRPPLRVDPDLTRIAREYSCALLKRGALSHTGADGTTVADRIRASGKTFIAVGENLASSAGARDPVAAAMNGWMASAGHRENILRPDFTDTGVGVCREGTTYYFTQIFLRPGRAR
jgi:uncharacterized protein YkwD